MACTFIAIVYATTLKAQDIKFPAKKTATYYRKADDQVINIPVNYTWKVGDQPLYNISVEAVQEGDKKIAFKSEPKLLSFGKDYSASQQLKITLLKDTEATVPCLIKLTLKRDTILDTFNIFYQPASDLPKTTEGKLLKSNEDIKADFNTLRAQILDGDTSRTYIGKFVIPPIAHVIPAGGYIRSKPELDKLLTAAETNTANISRETAKNREKTAFLKTTIPAQANGAKPEIAVSEKEIDSVVVTIKEGEIEFLKVKLTDNSYFINTQAPISLLNIEKRFDDKLFNPVDKSYIFLKDALNFNTDKRFNFFPSDGTFYLTNNLEHPKREVKVFANNGLNSFIDFRVFTDLLGALDNQPNGLLQIEARSKIYLHRSNVFNRFMYIFYGLEPYLGISKFDTKYDTIKIANTKDTINRMNLFQRSFIKVGLKLNVFRWDFRPSNSLYFNLGYQFNAGNISVRDSKNKADSIVATGILNTPYIELGLSSMRLNNFGFEGEVKYMFQQLNKNKYFTNSGYNRLMNFSVTAFYYPGTKPKDRFFVRFSDYLNYSDRREDFYQLQFGYSLNLKL